MASKHKLQFRIIYRYSWIAIGWQPTQLSGPQLESCVGNPFLGPYLREIQNPSFLLVPQDCFLKQASIKEKPCRNPMGTENFRTRETLNFACLLMIDRCKDASYNRRQKLMACKLIQIAELLCLFAAFKIYANSPPSFVPSPSFATLDRFCGSQQVVWIPSRSIFWWLSSQHMYKFIYVPILWEAWALHSYENMCFTCKCHQNSPFISVVFVRWGSSQTPRIFLHRINLFSNSINLHHFRRFNVSHYKAVFKCF